MNKQKIYSMLLVIMLFSSFPAVFGLEIQENDYINDCWDFENEIYTTSEIDIQTISFSDNLLEIAFVNDINQSKIEQFGILTLLYIANSSFNITFMNTFTFANESLQSSMSMFQYMEENITITSTFNSILYGNKILFQFDFINYDFTEYEIVVIYAEGIDEPELKFMDFYPHDKEILDFTIFDTLENFESVESDFANIPEFIPTSENEQNSITSLISSYRYLFILVIVFIIAIVGFALLKKK